MKNEDEIKEFWDNQARTYGTDSVATMPDGYLKRLEIDNIKKYLSDNAKVADIGCGNGYSTFAYADEFCIDILGIDYSKEMIVAAESVKKCKNCESKVKFENGTILDLDLEDESFDYVITDRCLINLTSREEQESAIKEVCRILKPGGKYIMCEDTEQGLRKLNSARKLLDLDEISVRWHNLYLDEEHINEFISDLFVLEKIDLFASYYYLVSRTITGKLAQINNSDPDYKDPINYVASLCSSGLDIGDFTPLKIYVLKKK